MLNSTLTSMIIEATSSSLLVILLIILAMIKARIRRIKNKELRDILDQVIPETDELFSDKSGSYKLDQSVLASKRSLIENSSGLTKVAAKLITKNPEKYSNLVQDYFYDYKRLIRLEDKSTHKHQVEEAD